MSEVRRWNPIEGSCLEQQVCGCFVEYSDYAKLKKENKALRRDAERYRFIKLRMRTGAVQTQLPLYRTLHWIGYEACSDLKDIDATIDAEINQSKQEGGKNEPI